MNPWLGILLGMLCATPLMLLIWALCLVASWADDNAIEMQKAKAKQ